MAKSKADKKKPNRKRYEEEHPTISFRVDRETYNGLKDHLAHTGCSFADFVKDSLGREKSMVEKRVEMLASHKVEPSFEDSLKWLEILVNEIITTIGTIPRDEFTGSGVTCPRCSSGNLSPYAGKETTTGKYELVWNCGKCGFLTKSREPLEPESLVLFPAKEILSFKEGDYHVEKLLQSLRRLNLKVPRPRISAVGD